MQVQGDIVARAQGMFPVGNHFNLPEMLLKQGAQTGAGEKVYMRGFEQMPGHRLPVLEVREDLHVRHGEERASAHNPGDFVQKHRRVRDVFEQFRPDLVFHAAALKHVPMVEANPQEGLLTNVAGTRHVADAARGVRARAMVLISTDKAVNPSSVMGASKRVAELIVQSIGRDAGNTLFVTDGRGDPTVGWTLSATMVETPKGNGVDQNPNPDCAHVVAFCNADVGSHALEANGRIAATLLSVKDITCDPHPGNVAPPPTPGAGGNLAAVQVLCTAVPKQGFGTFDVNRTYQLVVPSSTYAGSYRGTVEYMLA